VRGLHSRVIGVDRYTVVLLMSGINHVEVIIHRVH